MCPTAIQWNRATFYTLLINTVNDNHTFEEQDKKYIFLSRTFCWQDCGTLWTIEIFDISHNITNQNEVICY